MTDILSLTAVELGKKIAAGEITSVEATKAYLNRIGEADKEIHRLKLWVGEYYLFTHHVAFIRYIVFLAFRQCAYSR